MNSKLCVFSLEDTFTRLLKKENKSNTYFNIKKLGINKI